MVRTQQECRISNRLKYAPSDISHDAPLVIITISGNEFVACPYTTSIERVGFAGQEGWGMKEIGIFRKKSTLFTAT